jgi:hypothetical protein
MTAQQDTQPAAGTRQLAALRGSCMGAAILPIVQSGLGQGVNLYVTLPSPASQAASYCAAAPPHNESLSANNKSRLLIREAARSVSGRAWPGLRAVWSMRWV